MAQTVLVPNQTLLAHLQPGRTDSYQLELKEGDYIEVLAQQTQVDLVLSLAGPDGKQLQEVNFLGLGGTEILLYVAAESGAFRLTIRSALNGAGSEYSLQLATQRSASDKDRMVAATDEVFRQLVAADSPESAASIDDLARKFADAGIPRRQASALEAAGSLYIRRSEFDRASGNAEAALKIWRELHDRAGEARALNLVGRSHYAHNESQKAAIYYAQALAVRTEIKDLAGQAAVLNNLGRAYYSLGQYQKSTEEYQPALDLARQAGDSVSQALALQGLGDDSLPPGQFAKALDYYEQSLTIWRDRKDRSREGRVLADIAYTHFALSQQETAIGYYEQALAIARELNDRAAEGHSLNGLGIVYGQTSQYDKAIVAYEQSLAIARETKDRSAEENAISNLGELYTSVAQYEKAISNHEQGLAMARSMKDRVSEGFNLGFLGRDYRLLGQGEKAIGYYEQALKIASDLKILVGIGMLYNELGLAYASLTQYDKAVNYYDQALALERKAKNRAVEGWVLLNLGNLSLHLNRAEKAIGNYEQALAIARDVKDHAAEGEIIGYIGLAYGALHQPEKAVGYGEQALSISRQVKNRRNEHDALFDLMQAYRDMNQPRLAVFYGKQAVNVVQDLRSEMRGLNRESRTRFLESKSETYRTLANLLVAQGRLIEAQQVLNLLKEQEFFDYVRRNERSSGPSGRADLTEEESQWADRYRKVSEVLVAMGVQMDDLESRIRKHPALLDDPTVQEQRAGLQKDLEAGNRAFQQYLGELKLNFATKPDSPVRIDLGEVEAFKSDLAEMKHGAVAIYTLVTPDRYRAILVTPRVERAYESPIQAGELNPKILAFREAVQNAKSDPRELAHDLYRILIPAALEHDLQEAGAHTLMWSLDGPLRYVPIAALYDGKQYLIEKYRVAVFTPASQTRLMEPPRARWRAAGFGVTQPHEGFAPLPSVTAELAGVVRENPSESGVLDGRRLLDDQFTRESMDRELIKGYPVVHVASHFSFRPGDETHSFLLLGDGGRFSLADLKNADTIFAGVDLLTLSACSTGLGDIRTSDGSEVEGFGVLAQRKGAKAVVASLWPVADESTALMMREFYRIRQSKLTLTKLDALREAQLELLHGKVTAASAASRRGLVHELVGPEAPRDFRHPYFWAPFFLMGNWL